MAGQTSLFYKAEGYSVGEVVFDLLLDEGHALENDITSHNVEDGSKISDHIKNRLRVGSLTGAVYNYSIQKQPTFLGATGSTVTALPNRALTAFDALKLLWRSRETVKIVTTIDTYDSVAIASITPTRENAGEVLEFNITFQELKKVKLKEQALEASVSPLNMNTDLDRQAAPKVSLGKQVGT